jgi:hypothetical protein
VKILKQTTNFSRKATAYCVLVVVLTGCATAYNPGTIKTGIVYEEQRLEQLTHKIDSLDSKRMAKLNAGLLDEITDSVTKVYIKRLKDSVNARLNHFNAIVSDSKNRQTQKENLAYLSNIKRQYDMELNDILFLDDLFKASTFNRLNTAAFFEPGEYLLTDSSSRQARLIMQKIMNDANEFSLKYADRKLKAMFIILGYADEAEFSGGTSLYKLLTQSTGMDMSDRKHLNTELSNKRAASIKKLLQEEYNLQFSYKKKYLFSASFIATGKGEMVPPGSFKNYKPVDERRRVVLLYWSILPDKD